ncbi:DNA-3-methyladenine glycosylase [Nonomuraea sp. NPDC050404]|uniref:DNA-3-methyladenine glycosylase n=1 Tax=Nonomuraea sp. NPDC050404 TaxID=3155783 RepID=UPI003404ED80
MGGGQLSSGSGGGLNPTALPRGFFDRPSHEVAPDLLGRVLVHGTVAVRLTEVEAYGGPGEDPAAHTYRGRTPRNAVMFGPPGHLYVYFTYGMHFCANLVCLPDGHGSAVLLRAGEVVAGIPEARDRRTGGKTGTPQDPAGRPIDNADTSARRTIDNADTSARRIGDQADPSARHIRDQADPSAPHIRDQAGTDDPDLARPRRASAKPIADRDLARGPARLAVALGLMREHNGLDTILAASSASQHDLNTFLGTGRPHNALIMLEGRPADPSAIKSGPRTGVSTARQTPWRFWIDGDPTVSPYRAHAPRRRSAAATSVGEAPNS